MKVPDLTENEALELLSMPSDATEEDLAAGKSIVNTLGRLPLAVVSASGQIASLGLRPWEYLLKFKEYRSIRGTDQADDGEKSVSWDSTYEYSFELLSDEQKKVAVPLLSISAFLGEATIQEYFFKQYSTTFKPNARPSWLSYFHLAGSDEWNTLRFRKLAIDLGKQGLIQRHQSHLSRTAKSPPLASTDDDILTNEDTDIPVPRDSVSYSLHPVIREWLRRRPHQPSSAISDAVNVMGIFVRTVTIDAMSLQTRLDVLTHLNALVDDPLVSFNDSFDLEVPLSFSNFYRKFSRIRPAKKLLRDVLQHREKVGISPSNPDSLRILLEEAETSADNAEHETAMREFTQALEYLSSPTMVEKYPELRCRALLGRAHALCAAFKPKEAHPLVKEAEGLAAKAKDRGELAIRAQLLDALIWGSLGFLSKADEINQKAHRDAIEKLGETDNLTLEMNLRHAEDLALRRKSAEAKRILVNTIHILEKQNGEHHRLVLNAFLQLGVLCGSTPQHDVARTYFQLAKSRAGILFGDTPGDVDVEILIGYTYLSEGDYNAAERQFKAARKASENRPDFDHVLNRAMVALLRLYVAQRKILEVIPLLKYFYNYFPFAAIFRRNRTMITIAVGLLLCLLYSLQAHLKAVFLILLGVVLVGQVALG